MSCSEILPTLRDVFLDRHIGVTESHETHLVAFFGCHGELLSAVRITTGLVVS